MDHRPHDYHTDDRARILHSLTLDPSAITKDDLPFWMGPLGSRSSTSKPPLAKQSMKKPYVFSFRMVDAISISGRSRTCQEQSFQQEGISVRS